MDGESDTSTSSVDSQRFPAAVGLQVMLWIGNFIVSLSHSKNILKIGPLQAKKTVLNTGKQQPENYHLAFKWAIYDS